MSGSGDRMDTEMVTTAEADDQPVEAVVAVSAPTRESHADDTREVVFDIDDLSVFYGSFRAVRNVSLDIRKNEITALIGPSGCGKTTVLRCLNRMNDLVEGARIEGKVNYHGVDLYDDAVDPSRSVAASAWSSRSRTRSRSRSTTTSRSDRRSPA